MILLKVLYFTVSNINFFKIFLTHLKIIRIFFIFDPHITIKYIHFPIPEEMLKQKIEVVLTFNVPKGDDRHTKLKHLNTHIIVK